MSVNYLVTTGPEVLGTYPSINAAVNAARQVAGNGWLDCVIWHSGEVVTIVRAGGVVESVPPPNWQVAGDWDDGDGGTDDGYHTDPPHTDDAGDWIDLDDPRIKPPQVNGVSIPLLDAADMPLEDDVPW